MLLRVSNFAIGKKQSLKFSSAHSQLLEEKYEIYCNSFLLERKIRGFLFDTLLDQVDTLVQGKTQSIQNRCNVLEKFSYS